MRRFLQVIFGLSLTLTMIVSIGSIAFAEVTSSVQVNGHIVATSGHHIHYNANGGTGSYDGPDIAVGSSDQVCSLSRTGITRSGYTFIDWNIIADGSGISYIPGDIVILSSDITLYAQWEKAATERAMISSVAKTGDTSNRLLRMLLPCASLNVILLLIWGVCPKKRKHSQEP